MSFRSISLAACFENVAVTPPGNRVTNAFKRDDGEIILIEVKSGSRKKAKSLRYYIDTYAPKTACKPTATTGGFQDQTIQILPLYYAKFVVQQFA